MTERAVIDSSVALKWWLDDEEYVDEARGLLNKVITGELELCVPELWYYEILNGITIAVKRGRVPADMARDFIDELLSINITIIPVFPYLSKIHHEAARHNHAVRYDLRRNIGK